MAELADAHGSGPCDSNIMRVQVPSSARRLKSKDLSLFCLVESSDGTSHHQFARSVQYASRSSLPSIPFTAIPSPIKLQTWIVASGKPFESCKHSHRQPSAASASSPPTHSAGEAPGMDRLIPGAGFLLAHRRMRWRAADTCLSAASCVRSSPSLAFFCGLRGNLPESRSVQARSLTGPYLPTL